MASFATHRARVASRSAEDHDAGELESSVERGPNSLQSTMLRGLRPSCTKLGEWASTIGMAPASIAFITCNCICISIRFKARTICKTPSDKVIRTEVMKR